MAAALYDPVRGYYARETRQVGRGGDFFTSVSTGPLFGRLLAIRFLGWWEQAGKPGRWRLIEAGAHDGTLARDILTAIREDAPQAFAGLEYGISEPLPGLAHAQGETLAAFGDTTRHFDGLSGIEPLPGIAFGNELLDALPFHVIEWRDGAWSECRVDGDENGFRWNPGHPLSATLAQAVVPLGAGFPDGYRTEIRPDFAATLAPFLAALSHGRLLWIDYGFARPDYYQPARTSGTLRTFQRHRAGEDPLDSPGERDITAHVDFTAVAEAAESLGATAAAFEDQGSWLTRLAMPWLQERGGELSPAEIRQFQTLVHPAHLGMKFHVLELGWREAPDPTAAARARRRLVLD